MNQVILTALIVIATTTTLVTCRDVRVKCVEHCDVSTTDDDNKWTLNGPDGKTVTLKYILSRRAFQQFHLQYNNETILITTTEEFTILFNNATVGMLEFTDKKLIEHEDEYSFTFQVNNLNKSIHHEKQFDSFLVGGGVNETDVMEIYVHGKDYVPAKEDVVSLTAGIVMVVLMCALVVFFVVLYRNEHLIGESYSNKVLGNLSPKESASVCKVPPVVESTVGVRNAAMESNGGVSMNVANGAVEMHDVPLYSDEEKDGVDA